MNILLYKPLCYDLVQCANDINFCPDEGIINNAINSFFLERTPTHFRWLEVFKIECSRRRKIYYPPVYWIIPNPRKEVFKKLEVVSVY